MALARLVYIRYEPVPGASVSRQVVRSGEMILIVGAVIIGRNEGLRLEACLRSVLAQTKRVVYADSGSTDGSPDRAREHGVSVVSLSPDLPFTAARGRNEGAAKLLELFPDCEAIQFIDGDCVLHADWIATAVTELARRDDAAVICGRRYERNPSLTVYNAASDREWNTPIGEAEACGGDSLIRTRAFAAAGGFNPRLHAGEEPELSARLRALGWRIWRIDALMTEHDMNMVRLGQWWGRAQRSGFGYAQVSRETRALPGRLYVRQLRSALFWAILVPSAVVGTAVLAGVPLLLLLIPLAYGAQIARIALRQPPDSPRWRMATLTLLAKFPETLGALRFYLGSSRRHSPDYR